MELDESKVQQVLLPNIHSLAESGDQGREYKSESVACWSHLLLVKVVDLGSIASDIVLKFN